ncbi:MAG TPA: hypothetical protein VL359_21030 [bacterium]|nr:hypothetical protein [bacterium]
MIPIQHLQPGIRIKLKGDVIAEVLENPGDGNWLLVRWIDCPGQPEAKGKEVLCYADDVDAVL